MRLRRLNNVLHRDLGYPVAGTAVPYAVSGLAPNHADDWNPNFILHTRGLRLDGPKQADQCTRAWIDSVLEPLGERDNYRAHDWPTPDKIKIYLDDGSVFVDLAAGEGVYESVRRRPFFHRANYLHLNPKTAWLVFSDLFAAALIVVSLTGLFVLKGRDGITRRGAVLTAVGLLVPLFFLLTL